MGRTVIPMNVTEQLADVIYDFSEDFYLRDDSGFDQEYAETGLRDWLNARHKEDAQRLEYAESHLLEALMPAVSSEAREKHLQIVLRELRSVQWKLSRGSRKWPDCYDGSRGDGYEREDDE